MTGRHMPYWGNGNLYFVKLNKDMVSYAGEIWVPQSESIKAGRIPINTTDNPVKDRYMLKAPGFCAARWQESSIPCLQGMTGGTGYLSYSARR